MNLFSLKVVYYDLKCLALKWRRTMGNLLKKRSTHRFIFLLCPAYGGSTLLHEIINTSPSVSTNNVYGTCEGQSLPEFRKLILDKQSRWLEDFTYPWSSIKNIWLQYWDLSKPLLMEKSPPNLLRASEILQHFQPVVFIAMVRNPYILCEAMIRRDKMSPTAAASRTILCLNHQKQNLEKLELIHLLRYEDLVSNPTDEKVRLLAFLPELQSININRTFKSHNERQKQTKIVNMNIGKIERLSDDMLNKINKVFDQHRPILQYFHYSYIDTESQECT